MGLLKEAWGMEHPPVQPPTPGEQAANAAREAAFARADADPAVQAARAAYEAADAAWERDFGVSGWLPRRGTVAEFFATPQKADLTALRAACKAAGVKGSDPVARVKDVAKAARAPVDALKAAFVAAFEAAANGAK